MNNDQARALLEDQFGAFSDEVRALYTLLLAAEERIRDLETRVSNAGLRSAGRASSLLTPAMDGLIREAFNDGRSVADIAIGYFLSEDAVDYSLRRTSRPQGGPR